MKFVPHNPDHQLSPYTGLTWEHWVDAGSLLLEGVFRQLKGQDRRILLPRQEKEITYPRPGDPPWLYRGEILEGISRTLLVAAPILAHYPDLEIAGVKLAEYYRKAILGLSCPASETYIGGVRELVAKHGDRPYQMTVECASLVIALRIAPKALWDPLSAAEKAGILDLLHEWGHHQTHPHNWRLFNIHILAFLKDKGVVIDEELYRNHASAILALYAGDGWYRDGTLFDYYSVWAFQFYAPLWVSWSGRRHMPGLSECYARHFEELLKTYDRLFDRNGRQFMWGRSNIYRFAACAPFGSAFFLEETAMDPGVARRVMSGNMMQFLGRTDFWFQGVPSIGFYGPFKPLVQPYSCAASPFWFGNSYQAVALGPSHPLWSVEEKRGSWSEIQPGHFKETELRGPGIVVTQYGSSGSSQMRTGKVMIRKGGNLLPNYSRLAFHSALPWQADTSEGMASCQYNLREKGAWASPNLILYGGKRSGILYRRLVFDFQGSFNGRPAIDLADWSIPEGLVRCDRTRFPEAHEKLVLTHFALPVVDGKAEISERRLAGGKRAILASSGGKRIALVAAHGWDSVFASREAGLHPESGESILLAARSTGAGRYKGDGLRVSVLLHRLSGDDWRDEELWPFAEWEFPEDELMAGQTSLQDKNGQKYKVDFSSLEGSLLV